MRRRGLAVICLLASSPRTHAHAPTRTRAHRHRLDTGVCTVHTSGGALAWLIRRSIRSLTVTNSQLTGRHTKKSHSPTPNLWGGDGGYGEEGRGRRALTYRSAPCFFFFSFLFLHLWWIFLTSSWSTSSFFPLFFFLPLIPIPSHFLVLISIFGRCSALPPFLLPALPLLLGVMWGGGDRFHLSSFILEAETTAAWCDPSRRRWRRRGVPDHRPYQSHS